MTPTDDAEPEDAPAATSGVDAEDGVDADELLARAREAAGRALAPYSEYRVGAALATPSGTYVGCNLEVANYSNSMHAEEVALGSALADGTRRFDALAVSTGARDGATPCGSCRQTLWEFCPPELPVLCDEGEDYATYALEELLPAAFSLEDEAED